MKYAIKLDVDLGYKYITGTYISEYKAPNNYGDDNYLWNYGPNPLLFNCFTDAVHMYIRIQEQVNYFRSNNSFCNFRIVYRIVI